MCRLYDCLAWDVPYVGRVPIAFGSHGVSSNIPDHNKSSHCHHRQYHCNNHRCHHRNQHNIISVAVLARDLLATTFSKHTTSIEWYNHVERGSKHGQVLPSSQRICASSRRRWFSRWRARGIEQARTST
eukprot:4591555-Pyramimonas_sp.AAC.1